mgnify:CR=1 FL=1
MSRRPAESFIQTSRGAFRALTWGTGEADETALLLHGLTAVAEVWGPVATNIAPPRRLVAIDQRGHGDSPHDGPYTVGAFVRDTKSIIDVIGAPVHLVGHSMGARVAIAFAARYPGLLRSVVVADIGVEASARNIRETRDGIQRMPPAFENEDAAIAFAFRQRAPGADERDVFLARLRQRNGGGLEWRGSPEAMVRIVEAHRSRSYWKEWRSIAVPALFVHGGRSREVSQRIADRMRDSNPAVRYLQFPEAPHNIPLATPERLAEELAAFWSAAERRT